MRDKGHMDMVHIQMREFDGKLLKFLPKIHSTNQIFVYVYPFSDIIL